MTSEENITIQHSGDGSAAEADLQESAGIVPAESTEAAGDAPAENQAVAAGTSAEGVDHEAAVSADSQDVAAGTTAEGQASAKIRKKLTREQKHKRWFWVRLVVFVALSLILLTYTLYVLTPKYIYGICSMFNYYGTDKETIDVLAVGTSLTYTDLNTNILWDEYGIACYDLGTAEQPYWSTYYYLKEALKTLDPKVVLLDLKATSYLEDKVDRTRTVLCSYGLLDLDSRLHCIYECVDPTEFWGYALGFSQVHTNYYKLKNYDFVVPPLNGGKGPTWKGYYEKDKTAEHEAPNINFEFKTPQYVNEHEMEFFEKILQLCVDQNVEVMLIGYPNADYKHDHLYYCKGFEIAAKYGISGINYNLPENATGINYATDCADWQHLNIGGSVTFTRAVGKDLKELYNLEDHRGDPKYASYDECANIWFAEYPQYRRILY